MKDFKELALFVLIILVLIVGASNIVLSKQIDETQKQIKDISNIENIMQKGE